MGVELDLEDMEYLEYLYMYGDISESPRRRRLLAKTLLVSAVFAVCIALLLMSLSALHGLREMSGQGQTAMADLQDDVGRAGPLAPQDATEPASTSSSLVLAFTDLPECYGAWYPLFAALNEVFNARTPP